MAVMFGGIADFGFLKLHAAFKYGTFLANHYKISVTLSTSSLHFIGKQVSPEHGSRHTGKVARRDGDELALLLLEVQAPS